MGARASICVLALLLATGCERRDLTREEAVTFARDHFAALTHSDPYPLNRWAAYERRSTWLVKFISDGGTGGPEMVELDKKTGRIIASYASQ